MISGIINVKVSVISQSQRVRLITLTKTLIISGIILKKIMINALSHRTQFIFSEPCSFVTVCELDIALGNHALRAQAMDYSLIC